MATLKRTIGIDLGGTGISFIDLYSPNKVIKKYRIETPRKRKSILDALRKNVLNLEKGAPGPVFGVGVAVAGQVDPSGKTVVFSPNLPFKTEFPLGMELERATGLPVAIENDANAAAIGEKMFGGASGMDDFAVITLGTGIGSGIFANGSLLRGSAGSAGEAGHIPLLPEGPPCGCGQRGCLEALASGAAIGDAYRRMTGDRKTAKEVCELARDGNRRAVAVLAEAGRWLGVGLVALVNLFNPRGIFFTGSLMNAPECYFEPAFQTVRLRSFGSSGKGLKIGRSRLGGDAGIIGAASLPRIKF